MAHWQNVLSCQIVVTDNSYSLFSVQKRKGRKGMEIEGDKQHEDDREGWL